MYLPGTRKQTETEQSPPSIDRRAEMLGKKMAPAQVTETKLIVNIVFLNIHGLLCNGVVLTLSGRSSTRYMQDRRINF